MRPPNSTTRESSCKSRCWTTPPMRRVAYRLVRPGARASAGFDVELIHRSDRTGYKAGALEAGLATAPGRLRLHPRRGLCAAPAFLQRPFISSPSPRLAWCRRAGVTSTAADSLLTGVQAMFLDGHFLLEHVARSRGGLFFNFNGTAGIWRKSMHRRIGWLAARYPDRRFGSELSAHNQGLEVRFSAGCRDPGRAASRHERL